uniref:Uncharacterized protein n=1 Tax=Arundo donax TaxID=35708 RepID=A0A0A8YGP6_ARUDO
MEMEQFAKSFGKWSKSRMGGYKMIEEQVLSAPPL